MREIKFRAWDKTKKALSIVWEPFDSDAGDHLVCFEKDVACTDVMSDRLIWMQYTGLEDKNGVEIFEGDIVVNGFEKPSEVVFDDGVFHTRYSWLTTDMEVIGNVYQNQELLNGGKSGRTDS
ncbi:MAG: YopX family protein [Sedimenticola sp.]